MLVFGIRNIIKIYSQKSKLLNACLKWNHQQSVKFSSAETINVTFVDREGNRATFPARTGRTLLEVAQMNEVDLEGSCNGGGHPVEVRRTDKWVETLFGQGPTCFFCHVQIPSQFHHLLPEVSNHEIEGLKFEWEEEYNKASRLACLITLEKKHDGLIVFVPDAPPINLL